MPAGRQEGAAFYFLDLGTSLTDHFLTIQLSEIGGVFILSFFTILINCFIVVAILKKRFLRWAGIVLVAFIVSNFIYLPYLTTKGN